MMTFEEFVSDIDFKYEFSPLMSIESIFRNKSKDITYTTNENFVLNFIGHCIRKEIRVLIPWDSSFNVDSGLNTLVKVQKTWDELRFEETNMVANDLIDFTVTRFQVDESNPINFTLTNISELVLMIISKTNCTPSLISKINLYLEKSGASKKLKLIWAI